MFQDFLPPLLEYCTDLLDNGSQSIKQQVLTIITELIIHKSADSDHTVDDFSPNQLHFPYVLLLSFNTDILLFL